MKIRKAIKRDYLQCNKIINACPDKIKIGKKHKIKIILK